MSKNIAKKLKQITNNKYILQVLSQAKPKLRKSILKSCGGDSLQVIFEIILNILNGNIKIAPDCKNKLKKYKRVFKKLKRSKHNLPQVRKLLVQEGRGAFIPLIVSSILSSVIGKLLK